MEDLSEKFIRIIVNGRIKPFGKKAKSILYESVVELAFGHCEENPKAVITVTYSKGVDGSFGSLTKGVSAPVTAGMIFNVVATDLA